MKITVIGTGYVGIISAVGFAGLGHEVTCVDVDATKIEKVKQGIPPIYEAGLEERLGAVLEAKKLEARTDYASIASCDLALISVGTPSNPDGSMDMRYVEACARSIGENLGDGFCSVVVRSTVVPGTTQELVGKTIEKASSKKAGTGFGLAMVPEFLKEGTALEDFDAPDRIVMGCSDERTRQRLEELHRPFTCPKVFTDIRTAEMTKYVSNSFLATKVSFANEMAGICERLGIDVDEVMRGVGLDSRIGPKFLVAGPGFGGSCFPKDVKALISRAREAGERPRLLESVMEVNRTQQTRLTDMLKGRMPMRGKTVALLGLAFKENTDDVRESPAIAIIQQLLSEGAVVRAYDPQGMANMRHLFADIRYAQNWEECLRGADAALLVTAWKEFRRSAREYKRILGKAPLLDARRILKAADARKAGLDYHCIGRGEEERAL